MFEQGADPCIDPLFRRRQAFSPQEIHMLMRVMQDQIDASQSERIGAALAPIMG